MPPNILIIGGSDAGISAALRIREIDPEASPLVALTDSHPNFSSCGLPFHLSGETPDWRDLAHRTAKDIEKEGVRLLMEHTATAIDPAGKTVALKDNRRGEERRIAYDRLIIATGAESIRPPIEGIDLPGVFALRWAGDAFAIRRFMEENRPKSAVIIGAGYIGMEMADALTRRGMKATVVEFADSILTTVDAVFGAKVRRELERCGVRVATGVSVTGVTASGKRLTVKGVETTSKKEDFSVGADMVLVAVGARPQTALARSAGVETGVKGAIRVDQLMRTNVPDIFAAGDCVETYHRLLQQRTYMPLGSTAHKQGRVAGENAIGGERLFQGSLGAQVVKVFDQVVARTGLRDGEAAEAGFDPATLEMEAWDHKAYYPGAKKLWIRITGDRRSGLLLGAQMLGSAGSEVSKRIDVFTAAIYNGMTVDALSDLDLTYTPPLSSPWDPIQMSAQAWSRTLGKAAAR